MTSIETAPAFTPPPIAVPLAAEAPELWVLLWSQSQNALHIERLRDTLKSSRDAFADDRQMDYVPLYVGDRDGADLVADTVRPIVRNRAEKRDCTLRFPTDFLS